MRKDTGFNDKLLSYLYALEVQFMVDADLESELAEAQEAYDIPAESAAAVVEAISKKYISQLLNLALRAAKKYNEKESLSWMEGIVKYAKYVSTSVDADGNRFSEEDKQRLISFYVSSLSDNGDGDSSLSEQRAEVSDRLNTLIRLTDDFVAPINGIDGLLARPQGFAESDDIAQDKKKWAWGG